MRRFTSLPHNRHHAKAIIVITTLPPCLRRCLRSTKLQRTSPSHSHWHQLEGVISAHLSAGSPEHKCWATSEQGGEEEKITIIISRAGALITFFAQALIYFFIFGFLQPHDTHRHLLSCLIILTSYGELRAAFVVLRNWEVVKSGGFLVCLCLNAVILRLLGGWLQSVYCLALQHWLNVISAEQSHRSDPDVHIILSHLNWFRLWIG